LKLVRLVGNPLYHPANVRFIGLSWAPRCAAGPGRPEKVPGLSGWRITSEPGAAYDDVIGAADSARLPFLPGSIPPSGGGRGERTRTPAPATARTRQQARRAWRRGAL
jgi:hypothetical protein